MYRSKRVLAVVPARGGSKGVPLKNLHPLCGLPLIAHVGICVSQIPEIDRAIVSTDNDEIAYVAGCHGIDAPFRRPLALSGDRIGDLEVLVHALQEVERIDGISYDIVLMLQPTAPLRRPDDVVSTIEKLVDGQYDAVWTVSLADLKYHPLKQLTLREEILDYWDSTGASIVARQQLEPVYHVNGVAYAFTRDCLLTQRKKLGKKTGAVVLNGPAVSIDTLEDFSLVEAILEKRV